MRRWMRWLLVAGGVWMVGCQKSDSNPQVAARAKPEVQRAEAAGKSEPRAVELDATAQKEAKLRTETVKSRSIPQVIRANGRLTLNENTTWRVGAVTEGRIIEANAKVGDLVLKGQILARMHSHDIHEARAEYRRAVAEVNRIRTNRDFALRLRDRMKRLFDLKAASSEQLDHAENELKNANGSLNSAQIELDRTRLHLVEFLEVPVEGPEEHGHDSNPETHPEDLIPVRAPAAGVVVSRNVTPGSVVPPSADLFTIANLDAIWAIAAVQEDNLAKLKVGAPARVFVQAYPDTPFVGRIGKIGEMLDATTRTVSVRIEIANRAGKLKPEMYATVEIDAGGSESALFIDQGATQDINGQTCVFVRQGANQFAVRAVELGRVVDASVVVVRGLQAGDEVVVQGAFVLKSQLLKASMSEE